MARPVDMHPGKIAFQHADQIDHRIAAANRADDAVLPGYVGADKLRLAEIAERPDMHGIADVALGDAQARAALEQGLRHIATDKATAAKYAYQSSVEIHLLLPPVPCFSAFLCPSAAGDATADSAVSKAFLPPRRNARALHCHQPPTMRSLCRYESLTAKPPTG